MYLVLYAPQNHAIGTAESKQIVKGEGGEVGDLQLYTYTSLLVGSPRNLLSIAIQQIRRGKKGAIGQQRTPSPAVLRPHVHSDFEASNCTVRILN